MKLSLAKKIAAISMHDRIQIKVVVKEIEGSKLADVISVLEQSFGIAMPKTYAGRRAALRTIGCAVRAARVFIA